MKFIIYLLVLCLAVSVGCSLAQTDVTGNTCSISGVMTLEPVNMTGAGNTTGTQMYDINTTASCVPEAMNNVTGAKKCYVTGTATSISIDKAGNQIGNVTDNQTGNVTDNQTGNVTDNQEGGDITVGQTYNITATVLYTPKAMNNMTGGNQAGNMTGMDNMTGAQMYDIEGTMTLTPANMTGNQAGGNITVGKTYNITATELCMPEAMNNMTEGAQAGNMTEGTEAGNMTGMSSMTGAKRCDITGTATSKSADMAGAYNITATVECIPEAMTNMTGAQAGNMAGNMTETQAGNMTTDQTEKTTETPTEKMTETQNMTAKQTESKAGNQTKGSYY